MIVFKRSRNDIRASLIRAASVQGLDTSDGITREIVDSQTGFLESDYIDIYALERNTRIDTAENTFLDNYGLLLDEPRAAVTFAKVDDLQTISLFLKSPSTSTRAKGSSITLDGGPLVIEKGTELIDSNKNVVMRTLHTVELNDFKVYVKAIAVRPGPLTLGIGAISGTLFDVRSNALVDQNLAGDLVLAASNEVQVSAGSIVADEETYRFILQEKARSVNLSNLNKINTLMDNLEIRKFEIDTVNPASTSFVIYIETKNVETDSLVIEEVRAQLENILPYGTDVRVRPFVQSKVVASLKITVAVDADTASVKEIFRRNFVTAVNLVQGGTPLDFQGILALVTNNTTGVTNVEYDSLSLNGRKLTQNVYNPRKIEKVFAFPETVSYRV